MRASLERLVWQRANHVCEYRRVPQAFDELPFQIDHVIARKHSGATMPENLALACFSCNNHKGPNIAGLDPATGRLVPLFNPRRDKWTRHFQYDGSRLAGRTRVGRATVHVLAIDLPHRLALRQALIEECVFSLAALNGPAHTV